MNERVEDVNQKVYWIWMMAASTVSPLKTGGDWQKDFVKVFAELIVRECANVAADHDALDIYEEIIEHFGVEE